MAADIISIDAQLTRAERVDLTAEGLVKLALTHRTPSEAVVKLADIIAVASRADELLRALALEELTSAEAAGAEPYFSIDGRRVGLTTTPARWTYGDDAELKVLENKLRIVKRDIACREKFLQAMQQDVIDQTTGEVTQKPRTAKVDGYTVTGATLTPGHKTVRVTTEKE